MHLPAKWGPSLILHTHTHPNHNTSTARAPAFTYNTTPACLADAFNRWEAGQVLAKKLMIQLYHGAQEGPSGQSAPERILSAGGLQPSLVDAFRLLMVDEGVSGCFWCRVLGVGGSAALIHPSSPIHNCLASSCSPSGRASTSLAPCCVHQLS